ncbi:MAG: hypothetical protein ACP5VR_08520 [Acidimicrobiales bacterium]
MEIADGAPEGDIDAPVAYRSIAYVSLVNQRVAGSGEHLSELTEVLGARARSFAHRGQSPADLAKLLSLIGIVSDDDEVCTSVLRQQAGLVQEAIAQRRQPVVRELLDEVAAFATERLRALLEPAAIAWLVDQVPIANEHGPCLAVRDRKESPAGPRAKPASPPGRQHAPFTWIKETTPPSRLDVAALAALLPPAKGRTPPQRKEAEVIKIVPTLVNPAQARREESTDNGCDREDLIERGDLIEIAKLGDYLSGAAPTTRARTNTH